MSPAKRKTEAKKKSSKPKPWSGDHGVEVARELAAIAETHAVAELIYETPDLTLTIRRGEGAMMPAQITTPMQHVVAAAPMTPIAAGASGPNPVAAAPAVDTAAADDSHHIVTSPFVGTFYRAPNPDSPAYVEVGQRVEKGQTLCIVEAMKLMNEIEADVEMRILAVLVKNGEAVEYGQALFKAEPV